MDYFNLLTAHQNLLEIHRAHPEDSDVVVLLVECERQRDLAWAALQDRKRAQL